MKLFVGNLSWDATEDALRPLFEAHGAVVSVRIIQDPFTGRSRGYGFVEMVDEAACDAVIAALNEYLFLGRPLRVSRARAPEPREQRSSSGGERRSFSGQSRPRAGGRPFRSGGGGGGGNRYEE